MANKKISELAVRTPSLTDLMLVGDPSTGYSYKATISSLSTLLEANIALDDLNDVTITSPTAGQVLSYNGTAWVNDTNGITGTGTTNYVPKFTSSSAIGNSQIFDNGTNVGIGTATPSDKFSVEGFISTNGTAGTGGIMLRQSGSEITRIYATPSRSILTSTQQINLSINYGLNLTIFPTGNVGVKISDDTDSGDAFQVLGTVKFRTINNATTDTDKFIVSDGGVIKYRTGSEVLSDIGGAAASSISGTTNYIPKFTSSSAIGNSQIFDNGTSVGIATSSPQTQLDIANGLMFGTIDAFPSATYDAAAVIAKTGSLGSAPFNNAGSIVYRARVTSTAGRSSHIFYTGSPSTERMRLDESGNLGLGVTPSAWGISNTSIDIGNTLSLFRGGSAQTILGFNTYINASSQFIYKISSFASYYQQISGVHSWYTAPSGTAGNAITFTQAMTLDASGNLLVGTTTTSPSNANASILFGNTDAGIIYLTRQTGTDQLRFYTGGNRLGYVNTASSVLTLGTANFPLVFSTNDTERMRITSGGNVGIGVTNPGSYNAGGNQLVIGGGAFRGLTIAGTTEGNIYFADGTTGTETYRGSVGYNHTSDYLFFYSAANERMRITSSGELLINTTTDAGDYKLQVNGNAYLTGTTTVLLNMNNTTASTGKNWRFSSASNGNFYITHEGVVDAIQLAPTTGNATFAGSIKTAAPSGGTAKPFKIGAAATVTPTSQNRTIEIEIDGTTYYLTAKTTND